MAALRGQTLCLTALFLGFVLAGCGTVVPDAAAENAGNEIETRDQAQALWRGKGIVNYQVTVQQTCFCPADLSQPMRVTVVGGKLVDVKGLEQPIQDESQLDASRLTIAGLFEFIEQSEQRKVHKLNVDYDPHYGFPRRIDYDGHEMIADDEYQYELSDFQAGSSR
ncbi:DUF6174 domain-containing protein [Marinobacter sp.]|uniref:DUF6174 domain-containing protein n=1 Tax=Marinobacter sp. TaxID=50741 RepID=UPI003A95BFF8